MCVLAKKGHEALAGGKQCRLSEMYKDGTGRGQKKSDNPTEATGMEKSSD